MSSVVQLETVVTLFAETTFVSIAVDAIVGIVLLLATISGLTVVTITPFAAAADCAAAACAAAASSLSLLVA